MDEIVFVIDTNASGYMCEMHTPFHVKRYAFSCVSFDLQQHSLQCNMQGTNLARVN